MAHEAAEGTTVIGTLALGFVLAFVFGYVARRLRLPPLVGYLLAGIAIGPYTPGINADGAITSELAEMGVILLMFGVGLHFSVTDLLAVRRIAIPGAVGQILLATVAGAVIAHYAWGWRIEGAVIFGLCLSVASTVVLLRAMEDRNALDEPNGRIAVGWMIVEDLAMVLALVLLPTFVGAMGGTGGSATDLALNLALTMGKVAAFIALALLIGPRTVPWILGRVARTGSRELFTLSVLAIAVGIAAGSAALFGVSFALGAFFAGLILSESEFSHRAGRDSVPLQDAFAVLFFVSVGMLFDPTILWREPVKLAAVLALILVIKSLGAFFIVLALRFPVSTALTVSASLAQVGEFSFILAGLGVSTGVLEPEGRDLIVAGALISIAVNLFAFTLTDLLINRLQTGPMQGSALTRYGMEKFARLNAELTKTRQKNEAKEAARSLRAKELVKSFPLFAELDAEELQELLFLFRPRSASPGERLIRRGDWGDLMFFISSGAVEVDIGKEKIKLGPGQFFGEMALLSRSRRTADVTAIEYGQFLTLDQNEFRNFIAAHPGVRAHIDRMAAERAEANRKRLEESAMRTKAQLDAEKAATQST